MRRLSLAGGNTGSDPAGVHLFYIFALGPTSNLYAVAAILGARTEVV
jgi:hypothetical protein